MQDKTEAQLINIATWNQDDKIASEAMKELHLRFDKTYGWCQDCDGLVVKESECCLNQPYEPLDEKDIEF